MPDRSDIQRERARNLRLAGASGDANGGEARPPEPETEEPVSIEIEETVSVEVEIE